MVKIENIKTRETLESDSNLTFGNDRLLITDTNEQESTLNDLLNRLSKNSFFQPLRTLILNPYHPNIPEFIDVEKMAFRDMAERLGAREVRFKFGESVTASQLNINSLNYQTEV
ncbi:MAG: hypothetical protein AAF363_15150 [Bacteroidota bacterium]